MSRCALNMYVQYPVGFGVIEKFSFPFLLCYFCTGRNRPGVPPKVIIVLLVCTVCAREQTAVKADNIAVCRHGRDSTSYGYTSDVVGATLIHHQHNWVFDRWAVDA